MLKERNISIDRFRGIIIFLMILFQLLGNYVNLVFLSRICVHSPNYFITLPDALEGNLQKAVDGIYILPNMTIADIIAPAFMFAIGLTIVSSYKRRVKKMGKKKAVMSLIKRYLILLGLGVFFNGVNTVLGGEVFDNETPFSDILVFILTISAIITFILSVIFRKKTILKDINKYIFMLLGIFGIGISIFNFIEHLFTNSIYNYGYWNTLQYIGLSCIITILIISMFKKDSTKKRLIASIILFIIFTIYHELPLNAKGIKNVILIDYITDGGFIGALAYSSLLLMYTVLADVYNKDRNKFRKIVFIMLIPVILLIIYVMYTFNAYDGSSRLFTAGTNEYFMINKGSISPSYLIISLFISSFMFLIVDLFKDLKLKFDFFEIWGKSPILMYILEFFVIGSCTSLLGDDLIKNAPIWLACLESFILITILTVIAIRLHKKKKIIKI